MPSFSGNLLTLRGLFGLLARLPLRLLHALGAALGWLVYAGSPTYRRHLRENLEGALPGAAAGVRRRAIAHAGRTLMELPAVWLRGPGSAGQLVTRVSGWELVEQAWARGQGILFLTPHLGCFEVTAQYYALHAPITVLYRPPKLAWLQRLIEAGRAGERLRIAPADLGGVRQLLRALRKGEAVGMLPDHVPGRGEGVWARFFGRPAYSMTLAARLTESEPALIFAYAERRPRGEGFHLRLLEPETPPRGALEDRVQAINRELERIIRLCPEQYLWGYNRFKVPAGAPNPPASAAVGPA